MLYMINKYNGKTISPLINMCSTYICRTPFIVLFLHIVIYYMYYIVICFLDIMNYMIFRKYVVLYVNITHNYTECSI